MIEVSQGKSPLVLGLPHTGLSVPGDCAARLNHFGLALADTDWNIHRLYDGLLDDMTTVRTTIHRYVIDVNRDPSGQTLCPGENTTTLCPLTDFDGQSIYLAGMEPDAAEITQRIGAYHRPYHEALAKELKRIRSLHGFAVLYDCHSIRSNIPFLFEGRLPDLNIGTNGGLSCASTLADGVAVVAASASTFTHVVNGRFKGGWTTRRYGQPDTGIHAIQMELAQSTYMLERPPWMTVPESAAEIQCVLTGILKFIAQWSPE